MSDKMVYLSSGEYVNADRIIGFHVVEDCPKCDDKKLYYGIAQMIGYSHYRVTDIFTTKAEADDALFQVIAGIFDVYKLKENDND